MSQAFLIQLIGSAVAVAAMVAIAAWARIARPTPPLDEAQARALLAEEFPAHRIDRIWLAADGRAAIAKAGDKALLVSRLGDGVLARQIPWSAAVRAPLANGRLTLDLHDIGAPRAVIAMTAWPPEGLAA
jgi:hypothetical protein